MKFKEIFTATVIVGALGYFVDVYDLILFSVIRRKSLLGIGVPESELLDVGVYLLNVQNIGMFLGGVFWGVLGDKKGRVSVLFGSILLYSIANIANAFVTTVPAYAAMRFLAGFGLAGELGAAITLVAESLPKDLRGYGTSMVAAIGLFGGIAAAIVGDRLPWNWSYVFGGVLGIVLLITRLKIFDSKMFENSKKENVARGQISMLFNNWSRFSKYFMCIITGIPVWYAAGILITFSPEICKELGATGVISAASAVMYFYFGLALADFISGFVSQWLKSRKKVVLFYHLSFLAITTWFLTSTGKSPSFYYFLTFLIGFGTGYWAMFVTIAAEQFGTNLRSTVTTTTPNFVRGSIVIIASAFSALKVYYSLAMSAWIVGIVCIVLAIAALWKLKETFGLDLDYIET